MKLIVVLCLIGVALALPGKKRYGNPDEWGSYFQGDMRFKNDQIPKNGILGDSYRWPKGQVAYQYSSNFVEANKATVERAIQSYSDLTNGCITWVPRTNEADYVTISNLVLDSGCYSYVGKQGGEQIINYPQWCIDQYGSVQHEMYHTLGFFHEQSRPDRDDYVTIHLENVESGTEHNFDKYGTDEVETFGEKYDYGSVMHYSGYAFSTNGELTIVTNDPDYQDVIGQRVGLSDIDIAKLKKMYNC